MGLPKLNNNPNRGAARPTASKDMAQVIVNGSTDTAALTNPVTTTTKPATQVISTADKPLLRLIFGGTGIANKIINYQVIGWTPLEVAGNVYYIPQILAKGVATLGATIIPTAIVASGLMCDTITDAFGKPGASLRSPADDSVATLDLDVRGCLLVTVVTDLNDATTAYVWGTLGEQISNISAT